MPDLSLHKTAHCLRIYISESDRWRGKALDAVLLDTLREKGLAGATIFRGAAGFGAHSQIHTTHIEVLSMDLPIVIEVVDSPEKISAIVDVIYPMVREGLITLEEVQIVKYTHRYLNPLPADRLISEVMTKDVIAFPLDMPVHQVWKLMLEKEIKAAPVVDTARQVVGILTNEDLLERAGIQQRLSVAIRLDKAEIDQEMLSLQKSALKAADVMTHPVITVLENETLGIAAPHMIKAGLKRLPVVNASGGLVGMLSRLDILRQVADSPIIAQSAHLPAGAVHTVKDIMTSQIPGVNQDDDLSTIVDKFSQSNAHRLIVVDSSGKAIGLISDSDVVARIQPEKRGGILAALRSIGKPPAGKETAFDLMSPGPLTAPPDCPVVAAVQKMLASSRKWLVVVDDQNRPLGLVDRQILFEAIASVNQDRA